MAGACSCKSCCLGGLRKSWKRLGVWGQANGSLEPPEKQMAGACSSCKSCCLGGLREGWARPQTPKRLPTLPQAPRQQLLQLHAPAICFSGVQRAGKRQSWTPWKTEWQGHVAVRVVALEACGRVWGLRAGKRQSWTPEKQMAGACSCKSCCLGACGRVGSRLGVWGRANGSLEPLKNRWQACSCKSCCLGGLRKGWKRLGGLRAGKRQSWTPWKTDGRGM